MHYRFLWFGLLMTLLFGCVAMPEHPGSGRVAAMRVGGVEPIVLRVEGGPIDEPTEAVGVLTLESVLRDALHLDPRIQSALAGVDVAYAQSRQTRLLPNPVLSLVLKYPESGGSQVIEAGLTGDLLSLLQMRGRSRASDARLRAASAEVVSVVLDVVHEAQQTYVEIQALDAQYQLLQERLVLVGRLEEIAAARLEAGEAGRLELVSFKAERIAIEAERDALLLDRRTQRLRLSRQIGRPRGDANWVLDVWQDPAHQSVDEGPWIQVALEHRPEIQKMIWELAAMGEDARLARWSFLDAAEAGLDAERDSGEWSLGPGVSSALPIFDWGQASRAGANAEVIRVRHDLVQAQREAIEDVRRSSANFNESVHELKRAREQLLPLQRERRDLVESAYQAGQTDVTDLILADQDLADTRGQIVDLEKRVTLALIALHRAVGGRSIAAELTEQDPGATSKEAAPIARPEDTFNTGSPE